MTPAPLGIGRAVVAAGLAGFSCMAAELTAVRLQAPHFGDSAYVWTNVIGVILAALAMGAWLGGRFAGSVGAPARLVGLLLAAGGLFAVAPFVAGPLGAWLLPNELPLDAAMPAIVRGSLVATTALFAPPMLLLGAVAPMLVTRLSIDGVAVGRAAGSVSAAGTLGSLAGTFAATHWLVPTFGCRVALTLAGAVLLVAAATLAGGRSRAIGGVLLLLVASAAFAHTGPLRPPGPGRELLAERESRYQFLQVLREPIGNGANRTLLVINEALDSFHSVAIDSSSFTAGAYYDWHALAPLLVDPARRAAGTRALSIGDAAGTMRAVYAGVHPGLAVDAVDIDPACMELGAQFFRGDKAAGDAAALDGRVYLQHARRRWHVIHVDAYAHQVYVPVHLSSREFFRLAHDRLETGGVIACNVGALYAADPVLRAIGTTIAGVFGHAQALQVPRSRNFLVIARKGERPDVTQLPRVPFGDERLTAIDMEHWLEVLRTAADPQRWHDVGTDGAQLDDDRPLLDQLLHRSYLDRAGEPGTIVPCAGVTDPAGAEIAAYAAAHRADWRAVVQAVTSSRQPTAYLRELAGDARWSLRELHAAAAEYEAAKHLTEDSAVQTRLTQKVAELEVDRQPLFAAEAAASRNGWLLAALVGGLSMVSILVAAMQRRSW